MLQALPIALQALNLFSEAGREGYVTLTRSAHAAVVRVRVRSMHPIADRNRPKKGLGVLILLVWAVFTAIAWFG